MREEEGEGEAETDCEDVADAVRLGVAEGTVRAVNAQTMGVITVVQAVITLLMGLDDFNQNPAVRAAFINAVASSAKTAPSNVAIISVRDTLTGQTQAGRRLLQAQKRMEKAAAGGSSIHEEDPKIHVILQVEHATELRDVDLHLFSSGLEPSYDHAWVAPHKVVVTPE